MQNKTVAKHVFELASVEKAEAPEGLSGDNWYRYVLECGDNTIEGHKPGTLKSVTQHAKTVASDLNERKGSRGSTYAPRAQQRKSK